MAFWIEPICRELIEAANEKDSHSVIQTEGTQWFYFLVVSFVPRWPARPT
jgi:hypothetical protein